MGTRLLANFICKINTQKPRGIQESKLKMSTGNVPGIIPVSKYVKPRKALNKKKIHTTTSIKTSITTLINLLVQHESK